MNPTSSKGGAVLGLVSNLFFATKIAQAAKSCHVGVHNFDRADALLAYAKEGRPFLIILDWEGREAEAFQVLKGLQADEKLKKIATVGYLMQDKADVRDVAQQAGCDRVYTKTEFLRSLNDLVMRYAQ